VHLLPFESRKDTQTIFSYVLRFKPPNSTEQDAPALTYVINNRPEVIIELCRGYEHKESAMPCGTVLREILKHDEVAEIILYDQSREGERVVRLDQIRPEVKQTGSGIFWKFFAWIDRGAFEVSTDAFTTFRVSRNHFTILVGADDGPRKSLRSISKSSHNTSPRTSNFSSLDTTAFSCSRHPTLRKGSRSSC